MRKLLGIAALAALVLGGCAAPEDVGNSGGYDPNDPRFLSGYTDQYFTDGGGDLDCAAVGHEIFVGDNDPHGLDGDGDGIACENW